MKVLVADDEWEDFSGRFEKLGKAHGIQFDGLGGADAFSDQAVIRRLADQQANYDVLLVDIIHAGYERAGQDEAGIKLFRKLGENLEWQQKFAGKVQIVFFSNAATAQREYFVARTKRTDVSGFLSKVELTDGAPRAIAVLRGAASEARLYSSHPELQSQEISDLRKQSGLIYSPNSLAMHEVWRRVVLAGKCHEPVFISGATGSGKELVADAIRRVCAHVSLRSPAPLRGSGGFIPVNIAAIPNEGNLQYIELFGAEKGAYSGAEEYRKGVFENATNMGVPGGHTGTKPGATIFLDEIGDAHSTVQVALLRVLQEGRITPVGGGGGSRDNTKVIFRLISASHSLLDNVGKSFRQDLYMRLNGIHIHLPSLYERKSDIEVLAYAFIDKVNEEYGALGWKPKTISEASVKALLDYSWPGNVRELEMAIRSSYVLSPGDEIEISAERLRSRDGNGSPQGRVALDIVEDLRGKPRPLTDVARDYTESKAVEVLQMVKDLHGNGWCDNVARQYFGERANVETLGKWLRRKQARAKEQDGEELT